MGGLIAGWLLIQPDWIFQEPYRPKVGVELHHGSQWKRGVVHDVAHRKMDRLPAFSSVKNTHARIRSNSSTSLGSLLLKSPATTPTIASSTPASRN